MKSILQKYAILLVFVLLFAGLQAQSWGWAKVVGDLGQDKMNKIERQGNLIWTAGTFSGSLDLADEMLVSAGGADIFLMQSGTDGQSLWAKRIGGEQNESVAGIVAGAEGVTVAGEFWLTADLDTFTLQTTLSSSGLFLAGYNLNGDAEWVQKIESTGIKSGEALEIDDNGNLYFAGYFGGMLQVGGQSLVAQGEIDFFIIKFNPDGDVIWLRRGGASGNVRAKALKASVAENAIYVGGNYEGSISFAGDSVYSLSFDQYIYLCKYDTLGNEQWIRSAGNVENDICVGLDLDSDGDVYLGGYFSGGLDMGGGIFLQSNNLEDDIFILKYSKTGNPIYGKSYGGANLQKTNFFSIQDQEILFGGSFLSQLELDNFSFSNMSRTNGFIAVANLEGEIQWVGSVEGTGTTILNDAVGGEDDALFVCGQFESTTQAGDFELTASGIFDGFHGQIFPPLDADYSPEFLPLKVFPNPVSSGEEIMISERIFPNAVVIRNLMGQEVISLPKNEFNNIIQVPNISSGVYFLEIITKKQTYAAKIVVF